MKMNERERTIMGEECDNNAIHTCVQCTLYCIWINVYNECATWALIPFKDNFYIISGLSFWPFMFILRSTYTYSIDTNTPPNLTLSNEKAKQWTSSATDATLYESKRKKAATTTKKPKLKRWTDRWNERNKKNSHKVNIRSTSRAQYTYNRFRVFFSCAKPTNKQSALFIVHEWCAFTMSVFQKN